ncbi:hypothetical protein J437_LFUL002504, partial [Ladona fulva]
MAYPSAVHESTGQTPAKVLFGWELKLPCDLVVQHQTDEDVVGEDYVLTMQKKMDNIHKQVRYQLNIASDRIKGSSTSHQGGWLSRELMKPINLDQRNMTDWKGAYVVKKQINDVIYQVSKLLTGKLKVVHFNRLAPYEEQGDTRERTFVRRIYGSLQGKKFGHLEQLKAHHPDVGKVLKLCDHEMYILHLLTKENGSQKPLYQEMWYMLHRLRDQHMKDNIRKLAILKIGASRDKLNWRDIQNMLVVLLNNIEVEVL